MTCRPKWFAAFQSGIGGKWRENRRSGQSVFPVSGCGMTNTNQTSEEMNSMGMPNNSAWSVESVGADVMTNGEDASDLVITLRHKDGHALQHVTYFTLMGDVQINGERPDYALEGFVTSVDEHHDRAVSESSDDDAVTRSYWVCPWSETFDAIGADGDPIQDDWCTESTEVSDGWIDLDYTGRYDAPGMELENEIETALVKYGKRLADVALYATDLDQVWNDLTAA